MSPLETNTKALAMSTSLETVAQEQANLKEVRLQKAGGDRQKRRVAGSQEAGAGGDRRGSAG